MADDPQNASKKALLVVGSVSADTIETIHLRSSTIGGAGLYAALGAGAAGLVEVGLVGVVGDRVAAEAQRVLDRNGVHGFLHRVAGAGLAFGITYDQDWQARYSLDGATDETALTHELVCSSDNRPAAVHLCPTGSTAGQLEIARRLREDSGVAIQLSATTFRNRILSDRALVLDLWSLTDVFACDVEELRLLAGTSDLDAALTWALVNCGTRIVCVTDAQRGVYLLTDGTAAKMPAYPADTVDPTGAGESFAGAFAAGLLAGLDPHDCALLGAAVASLTVEAFGTTSLQDVDPSEVRQRVDAIRGGLVLMEVADHG